MFNLQSRNKHFVYQSVTYVKVVQIDFPEGTKNVPMEIGYKRYFQL